MGGTGALRITTGLINGPRSYEKAFHDTTDDFDEHGLDLDEDTPASALRALDGPGSALPPTGRFQIH